jgi:hypothetical protein
VRRGCTSRRAEFCSGDASKTPKLSAAKRVLVAEHIAGDFEESAAPLTRCTCPRKGDLLRPPAQFETGSVERSGIEPPISHV